MTAIDQTNPAYSRIAPLDYVSGFEAATSGAGLTQHNVKQEWSVRALLLRLLGGSMVLASTGIWLGAGVGEDPELALLRVGISVVFLFAGLALMLLHDPKNQPRVFLDTRAGLLVIEETTKKGGPKITRRSFSSLGAVEISPIGMRILERNGTPLIELPLEGAENVVLLRQQLSAHIPVLERKD